VDGDRGVVEGGLLDDAGEPGARRLLADVQLPVGRGGQYPIMSRLTTPPMSLPWLRAAAAFAALPRIPCSSPGEADELDRVLEG